jgi:hypothetical protein
LEIDWVQFDHPDGLFSLAHPRRWARVAPVSKDAALSCRSEDGSILLEVMCFGSGNQDLFDVVVQGIVMYAAHEEGMRGGRVIAQNAFPFGGAEHCASVLVAYRDRTDLEISADYLIVGSGRKALFVALKTPTRQFPGMLHDWEHVLGTLRTPWMRATEPPHLSGGGKPRAEPPLPLPPEPQFRVSSLIEQDSSADANKVAARDRAGLIAVAIATATWITLYQLVSGTVTFWGGLAALVIGYNTAVWLLRRKAAASHTAQPASARVAPVTQPLIGPPVPSLLDNVTLVNDAIESVMQHLDRLGEGRGKLLVVVSADEARLGEVKSRMLARGIVQARIARATAVGVERLDAIREGDVLCILMNPGTSGPPYKLPLAAYTNQKIMILDPWMDSRAMARVRACIEGE